MNLKIDREYPLHSGREATLEMNHKNATEPRFTYNILFTEVYQVNFFKVDFICHTHLSIVHLSCFFFIFCATKFYNSRLQSIRKFIIRRSAFPSLSPSRARALALVFCAPHCSTSHPQRKKKKRKPCAYRR